MSGAGGTGFKTTTKSVPKLPHKRVLKGDSGPRTPQANPPFTHQATLKYTSFQPPAPAPAKLTDSSLPRNKKSEFLHSSKSLPPFLLPFCPRYPPPPSTYTLFCNFSINLTGKIEENTFSLFIALI